VGEADRAGRPSVYLLWNPRWGTYQECAEGGLYAFGDPEDARAERDSLALHARGVEVVEMTPAHELRGLAVALSMYVSGPLRLHSRSTGKVETTYRATLPNGRWAYYDTAKEALDAICDRAGPARPAKVDAKGGCPFCGSGPDGWKAEAERLRMAAVERLSEVNSEIAERNRTLGILAQGIRRWAAEEDGVPDWLWAAYEEAHALLGMERPVR
jgi:hypothetical protein